MQPTAGASPGVTGEALPGPLSGYCPEPLEPLEPLDPLLGLEPLEDEPLLLCFLCFELEPEVLLPEPAVSLLEPDPIVEPLDPDPLLPPVDPVPPPLDCANAAPAPSIEITAKRFHHVLCMRKRSR